MKSVIFTDLDGTFLNHDNYSFYESKESLNLIKEKNIPLIFTTSKTKEEVENLQKKVGIKEPFITENGAALFIPKDYQGFDFSFLGEFEDYNILQFGLTYKQILSFYNKYKEEFFMLGFSDMSLVDIVKYTGLDLEDARMSKKRGFTEPFLLNNQSKFENLKNLARTDNIKITKGGRFYHLIGQNQDKGIAVKRTKALFEEVFNQKVQSLGLGDGPNDIAMFENVDLPIIIKNHKNEYVDCNIENIKKSTYQGSKGWNEMIMAYMKNKLNKK